MVKRPRPRCIYLQLRVIANIYHRSSLLFCPSHPYSGPNAFRGLVARRSTERHIIIIVRNVIVGSVVFIHPLCKQTCKNIYIFIYVLCRYARDWTVAEGMTLKIQTFDIIIHTRYTRIARHK